MSTSSPYAELFISESENIAVARARAEQWGCGAVSVGTGAALAMLAAAAGAHNVVEIGTGAGVSGLHLFEGMAPGGILTSIDVEADYQRSARESFSASGIGSTRIRLINGRALDVLPRLTDGGYDVALVDAAPQEYPQYIAEAVRLLRVGGILIVAHALGGDRVADPTQRDPQTVAIRDAGRAIRESEDLTPVLFPIGDGLLVAVKRA